MGRWAFSDALHRLHGRLAVCLVLSGRREKDQNVLRSGASPGLVLTLRSFGYLSCGVTLSSTDWTDRTRQTVGITNTDALLRFSLLATALYTHLSPSSQALQSLYRPISLSVIYHHCQ